ncbi:hypothetical protein ACSQ67_019968 [Phaseolus vulgaris]
MVASETCSMDMAGLSACSGMLNLSVTVGSTSECCNTLQGMGVHAAVCICEATKSGQVFAINLDLTFILLDATLTTCGMPTSEFGQCQ